MNSLMVLAATPGIQVLDKHKQPMYLPFIVA